MFCFSRANHASTNLKKFSSSKLDKFTLFTHSFVGWNLENRYKEGVSIFFSLKLTFSLRKHPFLLARRNGCFRRLADILSEKSPYFGKHLFAKQELITRARLRVQDFATGKNFSFNQCHNKEFFFFSQQLCKPSTSSRVCITVSNSPNPSRVHIRLCKHGKRFLLPLNCSTLSYLESGDPVFLANSTWMRYLVLVFCPRILKM